MKRTILLVISIGLSGCYSHTTVLSRHLDAVLRHCEDPLHTLQLQRVLIDHRTQIRTEDGEWANLCDQMWSRPGPDDVAQLRGKSHAASSGRRSGEAAIVAVAIIAAVVGVAVVALLVAASRMGNITPPG